LRIIDRRDACPIVDAGASGRVCSYVGRADPNGICYRPWIAHAWIAAGDVDPDADTIPGATDGDAVPRANAHVTPHVDVDHHTDVDVGAHAGAAPSHQRGLLYPTFLVARLAASALYRQTVSGRPLGDLGSAYRTA